MIYINIFKDSDHWNDQHIFVTNKDCSNLIEQIEECFAYEDAESMLDALVEIGADELLIKYVKTHEDNLCSPYDFTYDFLKDNGFLLDHKEYDFTC